MVRYLDDTTRSEVVPVYVSLPDGQGTMRTEVAVRGRRDRNCSPDAFSSFDYSAPAYLDGSFPIVCAGQKPSRVVVIDPGHGTDCAAVGWNVGAVGVTNWPFADPPAGYLKEDNLTVAFALEVERVLPPSKYKVILTKRDVKSCPSPMDRGLIARLEKAKVFISLHVNQPRPISGVIPGVSGRSALYNPASIGAKAWADQAAGYVSGNLGLNNRGAIVDLKTAVLKPTVTPGMPSIIVEAGRLSLTDEVVLHFTTAPAKVAAGVQMTLDALLK